MENRVFDSNIFELTKPFRLVYNGKYILGYIQRNNCSVESLIFTNQLRPFIFNYYNN